MDKEWIKQEITVLTVEDGDDMNLKENNYAVGKAGLEGDTILIDSIARDINLIIPIDAGSAGIQLCIFK